MIKQLKIWYRQRRLRSAQIDRKYWQEEVRRTQANASIAKARVQAARRDLHDARYPVHNARFSLRPVRVRLF